MPEFQNIYNQFISSNRKYESCIDSVAIEIFEKIYTPEILASIIINIENGKPGVLGITKLLNKYMNEKCVFDNQWKKACGSWVAFVLSPFGYIKTSSKRISDEDSPFSSGACFAKIEKGKFKLVCHYSIVECGEE